MAEKPARDQVLNAASRPDRHALARFFGNVEMVRGGCWRWIGTRNDGRTENSYGQMSLRNIVFKAHRIAYVWFVGDVPAGLELDHLCGHKWCANPTHLEAVTRADNAYRGWLKRTNGFCPQGHRVDGDNVIRKRRANGGTFFNCRACSLRVQREKYQRAKLRAIRFAS